MTNTLLQNRLYFLCHNNFEQLACEVVLSYLDCHLNQGDFDSVDAFLPEIDVGRLSPSVLLTILTITWHGREKLLQRTLFLKRVEQKMTADIGQQRTTKLLDYRRD